MSRTLDVPEARAAVCRGLCKLGFVVVHKTRGTRYLWHPGLGSGFRIRVSDHKQSKNSAARYNNVLKSLVMHPCQVEKVDDIVMNAAIGFLVRRDDRLGLLRRGPA